MHKLKPHHTETLTPAHASKRNGGTGDGGVGGGPVTRRPTPNRSRASKRRTTPLLRRENLYWLLVLRERERERGRKKVEPWGWLAVLGGHRTEAKPNPNSSSRKQNPSFDSARPISPVSGSFSMDSGRWFPIPILVLISKF